MTPPPMPKVPKKVYRYIVLFHSRKKFLWFYVPTFALRICFEPLYTIVKYNWIDPSDKVCRKGILKPGWFPIKIYNVRHPIQQWELKRLKKAQEQCRKNAEVNRHELDKIVINL